MRRFLITVVQIAEKLLFAYLLATNFKSLEHRIQPRPSYK